MAGTGSYITPRLSQASQIVLSTGTEPRSLSDIINFTQKSNLVESQFASGSPSWEQALRTVNHYFGLSQVYKESCTKYNCTGGLPVPRDVETAIVSAGGNPISVGVNPITNRIYVGTNANTVSVIDGGTNNIIATVSVGSFPSGMGVNPNTNRVYVANINSNTVSVINGTSNTVLTTINVGTSPKGVDVNNATNRIYVANQGSSTVSVINGTSNAVITTVTGLSQPNAVAVNFKTNKIYVANAFGTTVSVIDGATNTVTASITVSSNQFGVAVNPTTNRIYVPTPGTNSVSVIDGATNTVIATVPVGQFPFAASVNPTTNKAYVTNSNSNSVSVINATSNTLLNNILVGLTPQSVAANPITNLVYVPSVQLSVIGQREEVREACLLASANCLVVSSTGTLFPGTPQATAVNMIALSLRSNTTKIGTQMALTIVCDSNTTNLSQQCSAFYVDGNVWGPGQTDLSKSPFIIQNAEPYFYLQFHWWDFANSKIIAWSTWWYGTQSNPNWYWSVYWWWRTYVNYYIGIWIPWWWWTWHWTYWRYWGWWGTAFQA